MSFRQDWVVCPLDDCAEREALGWTFDREFQVQEAANWGSQRRTAAPVAVMCRPRSPYKPEAS